MTLITMNEKDLWWRRDLLKSTVGTTGLALTGATVGSEDGAAQTSRVELSNDHLRLTISETTGQFRMWTAEDQALLYPNSDTSFLTVRVDGESFVTGGSNSGTDMGQYMTDTPSGTDGENSRTQWELPSMTVDREISLEQKAARISVTVSNDDDEPHEIDIRYLLDYQVSEQDGAPIFVDGDVYTSEQRFESPSFDTNLTYDQIPDPNLVGVATNDGRVDVIDFVYWEHANEQAYEYTPDPSFEFYDPEATSYPDSDSAGVHYWEIGTLEPGEETTVSTYYGVGEPKGKQIEGLERSFEGFRDATTSLLSTTVRGRARAHAGLYAEVGEDYSRNLVNYFGYEADIDGIDASDVDSELREQLDTLTEGIDQPNAERLYRFFDELFAAASPDDPVEETTETFRRHFRGTAAEQEHTLLINGKTIDELETNFVADFDRRMDDALETLREERPSTAVVDELITFLDQKTNRVRTREQELQRQLEETVETIIEGGEVRTIGGGIENAGYGVLAVGLVAVPATGGLSKLVSLPVGGTLVLVGAGVTAVTGLAGLNAAYSGSVAASSLGWMQYSSMYWTMMTSWANSGPSARGVLETMIVDEGLEEFGLSPEQIIEDYTGVEIQIMTGLDDLAATQVQFMLDGAAEFADNIGQEVVVTDLTAPGISEDDIENGWATQTATMTVENRSSDPVTPTLNHNRTEIRSNGIGRVRPFPEVGSYVRLVDSMPEIAPGETVEIELEYNLPTEGGGPRFVGLYELEVSVSATPARLTKDAAVDSFTFLDLPDLPDMEVRGVLDGRLQARESETGTVTADDSANRITIDMSYGGSDLDLHLYDPDGNHVGRNYESGEFETEIPNVSVSGADRAGESGERIVVNEPDATTYDTEVIALEADSTGTSYVTNSTEIRGIEPILDTAPGEITVRSQAETVERLVTVEEVTGFGGLGDVSITPTPLESETRDDDRIPRKNLEVDSDQISIEAGGNETVALAISLPENPDSNRYAGALNLESAQSETTVPLRVVTEASQGETNDDSQSDDGEESGGWPIEPEIVGGAGVAGIAALYAASRMYANGGNTYDRYEDR